MTLSFSAAILLAVSVWVLHPLVSFSGQLVFPAWYPFETESQEIHVLLYLLQTLTGIITAFSCLVRRGTFSSERVDRCPIFDPPHLRICSAGLYCSASLYSNLALIWNTSAWSWPQPYLENAPLNTTSCLLKNAEVKRTISGRCWCGASRGTRQSWGNR